MDKWKDVPLRYRQVNTKTGEYHFWGDFDGRWVNPKKHEDYIPPNYSEQFTGVQDREGNDIYVGDQVYHHYEGEDGVVVYYPGTSSFVISVKDKRKKRPVRLPLWPIDHEMFSVMADEI